MNSSDLKKINRIHFVGVGGLGISAVARMMIADGKTVSGSDKSISNITEALSLLGVKISIEHEASNIDEGIELIIRSVAVSENAPELIFAHRKNIPVITYPEALGIISKEKFTIAISGTHGKTTTTAMTAAVLKKAGFDPTVIVGSLLKGVNSNFISGKSKYLVVEADEYRRAFLNLSPSILIINNIDEDHLDYFKDLSDIQSAFHELALGMPASGHVVCSVNDPHIVPVIEGISAKVIDYKSIDTEGFNLLVPGEHNRSNAKAALAVGELLGIQSEVALSALNEFENSWRRFEFKGETENGAIVYDDFAHNPPKVKAALQGAREKFPDKKIVAVFQPHLYSRTKHHFDDFAKAFVDADEIILAPIYAAREALDSSISSDMLADKIKSLGKDAKSFDSFEKVTEYLRTNLKQGEVLMTIGAGDVFKIGESLFK